jgi:prevent-host-death family protein
MKPRVVNVTEFKATCLALLDEIGRVGGTITITKRGRPLATVAPAKELAWKSPEGAWARKVTLLADPLNVDITRLWGVLETKARGRR